MNGRTNPEHPALKPDIEDDDFICEHGVPLDRPCLQCEVERAEYLSDYLNQNIDDLKNALRITPEDYKLINGNV